YPPLPDSEFWGQSSVGSEAARGPHSHEFANFLRQRSQSFCRVTGSGPFARYVANRSAPAAWRYSPRSAAPASASLRTERDRPFHDSRSPPNACYGIYPLVTTGAAGGGAFPLP